MDTVVVQARLSNFTRVTCGSTVVPDTIAGSKAPATNTAGLYAVTTDDDPTLTAHGGREPWVTLVPGFVGGAQTYTLSVFGLARFGSLTPTDGSTPYPALWQPLLIAKITVTADFDPAGATATGVIASADRLAGTLAVVAGVDTKAYELYTYGAASGAAYVRLKPAGFDYLLFESSESSGSAVVHAARSSG